MIQNRAMLVEMSITTWSAFKQDKQVSAEVDQAKGAKVATARVNKRLLAGFQQVDNIRKFVAEVWNTHYKYTSPWSDSGARLLTTASFFEYRPLLAQAEDRFWSLVDELCAVYPTLVSASAFQMGNLHNSNDYPTVAQVRNKFRFAYTFSPVPDTGDWRIDAANEEVAKVRDELSAHYEGVLAQRVAGVTNDLWSRLHECLTHMSERLADAEVPRDTKEGPSYVRVFRDTLVTNALEMCTVLTRLNVTGDPKLEQARQQLEALIVGRSAKDLREDDTLRRSTKERVDQILDMFS